jgi:hypothetical protein
MLGLPSVGQRSTCSDVPPASAERPQTPGTKATARCVATRCTDECRSENLNGNFKARSGIQNRLMNWGYAICDAALAHMSTHRCGRNSEFKSLIPTNFRFAAATDSGVDLGEAKNRRRAVGRRTNPDHVISL